MTAFAGFAIFDGTAPSKRIEEQMVRAFASRRPGQIDVHRAKGALFVQRAEIPYGQKSGERGRAAGAADDILFAADARLDNRDELAEALAIPAPERGPIPDAALILRLYLRQGAAGIARCLGAFAFAYWDAQERRLILGRDCLGNKALFFHRGDGFIAFATMLGDLLALPSVPRDLDAETLADYLAVNVREPRRTLYRGIERVPSRTLVYADREAIRHGHYWSPKLDAPPPYRREQDYVERARELFDQAVACSIGALPHVAISASGGLDSSAIAATAARLGRAARITCFTVVPPRGTQIDVGPYRYMDERDKMEALARLHPSLDIQWFADETLHPNEVDATRFFAGLNLPSIGTAVLGPYSYLYDAVAAAGHKILLVGNRGNYGLTWRGTYSLLALLRSGQWATFAREFSILARESGATRALKSEILRIALPSRARRMVDRLYGRDPDDVARFSALNPAYIAEHDLRRKWRQAGFDPWFVDHHRDPAQHRAEILFDYNQIARDMRGMNQEWCGFDFCDPHSDRRLLEFTLSVPEPMFRRNGVPRSFGRAVFADRLPPEILNETRRGAQTVTWFRNLNARRSELTSELESMDGSALARRLIDLPRLKRLMQEWPADEHAAQERMSEYRLMLMRALHTGKFIRWVEGGNT